MSQKPSPANRRDASGDEWLNPDFVEHVVVPRPFPQDDLEFLRRENRLLVLENVFDRNSRARRVDPRIYTVSLEQLRGDEVHEEQIRLPSVLLGEGLQIRGIPIRACPIFFETMI